VGLGLFEWDASGRRKHQAVLAIDGGGVRGLIPALVLDYIEKKSGKPIHQCFSAIAGTSTGGILAAALAAPDTTGARFSAAEVVAFYDDLAPLLFKRRGVARLPGGRLLRELYSSERLEAHLRDRLGEGTRLSQCLTRVLLPTADITHGTGLVLDSAKAQAGVHTDLPLVRAVRATSAAPTFFRPVSMRSPDGSLMHLVDGGLYANNPAELLVHALREPDPRKPPPPSPIPPGAWGGARPLLVISLGTGTPRARPSGSNLRFATRPRASAAFARTLANDVLNTFPDERLTRAILTRLNVRYVRFQATLDGDIALDKADAATRKQLRKAACDLLTTRQKELDELAAWLQ